MFLTCLPWSNINLINNDKSQSPQIGSMFLTLTSSGHYIEVCYFRRSQSPQIGSMFLTGCNIPSLKKSGRRRNPLKSGQCFLQRMKKAGDYISGAKVGSQFPHIGSMFLTQQGQGIMSNVDISVAIPSKSGHHSLHRREIMGETGKNAVSIPSHRVNVSYPRG